MKLSKSKEDYPKLKNLILKMFYDTNWKIDFIAIDFLADMKIDYITIK